MKYKFLLTCLFCACFFVAAKAQNDDPCGASVLNFPANSCGSCLARSAASAGDRGSRRHDLCPL